MRNILPRVNWDALVSTATELGLQALVPEKNPVDVVEERQPQNEHGNADDDDEEMNGTETEKEAESPVVNEEVLKKLHNLLLETGVVEGKLVCGNCGFEYPIKE
ncbi:hypothetical protein HRR75_007634, partial [Exophiala dermatitidis]